MKLRHQTQPKIRSFGSAAICVFALWFPAVAAAATAPKPPLSSQRPDAVQTTFKSVDATIAGQWDFPVNTPAPLVVLIPGGGRLDRNGWTPSMGENPADGIYSQLAQRLVEAGFAVFRYDKPGAGRSSPGRFATERSNALEAYAHAVQHARVDPDRVFLLGHSLGTDTISGIYPRFAAITEPAGVILLDSTVGESDSLRIAAPALIVNAGRDPDDRYQYGEFVVERRRNAEGKSLATDLVILDGAERGLLAPGGAGGETMYSLDPRATDAVVGWLMKQRG